MELNMDLWGNDGDHDGLVTIMDGVATKSTAPLRGRLSRRHQIRMGITPDQAAEAQKRDGQLYYGGVDISKIINSCREQRRFGFDEAAYVLITGKSPTIAQLREFSDNLRDRRELSGGLQEVLAHPKPNDDIMKVLQRAVRHIYSNGTTYGPTTVEAMEGHKLELIAEFPALVANAYRAANYNGNGTGINIALPSKRFSHAADFLRMLKGGSERFTTEEALTLDRFLMIQAVYGNGNYESPYASKPLLDTLRKEAGIIAKAKGRTYELGKADDIATSDNGALPRKMDLYSGFILDCLGIPQEMQLPIYNMGRVVTASRTEQGVHDLLFGPPDHVALRIDHGPVRKTG